MNHSQACYYILIDMENPNAEDDFLDYRFLDPESAWSLNRDLIDEDSPLRWIRDPAGP